VLIIAFQSTVVELVSIWSSSTSYSYAWLVFPALAYLLWHHRQRFIVDQPTWSFWGIAGAASCGVTWLVFDLLNIGFGRQFAFVAAIPCLVLAAVGRRVFARVAPSLALLALLIPSGDFLLPPLKFLTVNILMAAASLANIPHSHDGLVMLFGSNRYVVIDDCAGLPYVLTTTFLGLTFGLLMYRSTWRVGFFALLGIGCGILANGVRVISIAVLDWIDGTRMELSSHIAFQWAGFAFGIALMFVMLMFFPSEPEEPTLRAQGRRAGAGGRSLVAALSATVLMVSIPRVGLAHIDSGDETPRSLTGAEALLPERFVGWTKRDDEVAWRPAPRRPMPYALGHYARGNQEIAVFVAAPERQKDKVFGFAIDLMGPGQWFEANRRSLGNCVVPICGAVHALEFDRQFSSDVRHVYYVYALDDRIIGSALQLQLQRAWNTLVRAPRQARIVAVASDGGMELPAVDIVEVLMALVRS